MILRAPVAAPPSPAGYFVTALVLIIFARLALAGVLPLADTTEARYAEIARLMLESGDFVRLQHVPNDWFWAKPPLSTWMTVASFKLFGVSELAARLPALLFAIATALLLEFLADRQPKPPPLGLTSAVYLSMAGVFMACGTVMTDPAMVFTTTLAMTGIWLCATSAARFAWAIVALGLGLGLLAKGPVMPAIIAVTCVIAVTANARLRVAARQVGVGRITLLALLVAAPWYVLAERAMPGFINYFVVGEHFMRFTDSGWAGDRYGFAHAEPIGMIWIFLAVFSMPWLPIAVINGIRLREDNTYRAWLVFLLACIGGPLLLFTFAGNILWTYALPAMPAIALLVTTAMPRPGISLCLLPALVPAAFLAAMPWIVDYADSHSLRSFAREANQLSRADPQMRITTAGTPAYSFRFYLQGDSTHLPTVDSERTSTQPKTLLLVDEHQLNRIERQRPADIQTLNSKMQWSMILVNRR